MAKKAIIVLSVAVVVLGVLVVLLKPSLDRAKRDLAAAAQALEDQKKGRSADETRWAQRSGEYDAEIQQYQLKVRDVDRLAEEKRLLGEQIAERDKGLEAERKKAADLLAAQEGLRTERDRAVKRLEAQAKEQAELDQRRARAVAAAEESGRELERLRKDAAAVQEKLAAAEGEMQKLAGELERVRRLAPEISGAQIVGRVEEKAGTGKIVVAEFNEKPVVGLELSVFRESEFIARARVFRVFENYAGAQITFLQKGKDVMPGDIVKTGF